MPAALVSVRFLGVRGPAASEDTATVTRVPDEFREPNHMLKTIDESNPVLTENSTGSRNVGGRCSWAGLTGPK
jgi:hypothetical protein